MIPSIVHFASGSRNVCGRGNVYVARRASTSRSDWGSGRLLLVIACPFLVYYYGGHGKILSTWEDHCPYRLRRWVQKDPLLQSSE